MRCRLPNNTLDAVFGARERSAGHHQQCAEEGYNIPVRAKPSPIVASSRSSGGETDRHHRGNGDQRKTHAVQRFCVLAYEANRTVAHQKSGNDCGEKNSRAGRREPIQQENRWFRGRFRDDWRNAQRQVVKTRDRNLRTRKMIEKSFCGRQSPDKNDDAEDEPRHPRLNYRGARVAAICAARSNSCGLEPPNAFQVPEHRQHTLTPAMEQTSDDIDEPGPWI